MLKLGQFLGFLDGAAGKREDVLAEVGGLGRGTADGDSVLAREIDEAFARCVEDAWTDGADHHAVWSCQSCCPRERLSGVSAPR